MRPFQSKLMCSFVLRKKSSTYLKYLSDEKISDKIFILENVKDSNVLLFTFNLLDKNRLLKNLKEVGCLNSISLQRNKESNTLYSLDALNVILDDIRLKTEQDKKEIIIDWTKYNNSLLLVSDNTLNRIDTKLLKIISLDEKFDITKFNL